MATPITLNFTIDLDEHLRGETVYDADGEPIGAGPQTVEDVVIHAAAMQLAERATRSPYADALRQKVQTIRDELITAQIQPLIREAIDAAVQPTNSFGEASCAPTTLRSIIVDKAVTWLQAPAKDRSGYAVRGGKTNLDAVIAEQVGKAFRDEISQAVGEAKAEAVAAIRSQAATVLSETITRAARTL